MNLQANGDTRNVLRGRLYRIIYEANTPAGKWFDILLICFILLSVVVVMLDSIASLQSEYGIYFYGLEWFFTVLFTVEYLLRIFSIQRPALYIFSFFGIVDFLAIVPTYLGLLVAGAQYLLVIRVLRILRIFRILKLAHYISQINVLLRAVMGSRQKITVFLFFISTIIVIFGSLMYLIEGPENGFTSIPRSIYWAIITLTTVGYGDITPKTDLGQALASLVMITGYSIIAVPTGIFTAELSNAMRKQVQDRRCPGCKKTGHEADASYCDSCGAKL
ncbi:MAG: ion transporter [Pseudomonadota bacterium]